MVAAALPVGGEEGVVLVVREYAGDVFALHRRVAGLLPPEGQEECICGFVENWGLDHTKMMTEAGFTQGSYSTCGFYHKDKDIRVVVHGDDFTVLGSRGGLDWFREVIQRRTEVKFKGRLEMRRQGAVRILNRIATVENGRL